MTVLSILRGVRPTFNLAAVCSKASKATPAAVSIRTISTSLVRKSGHDNKMEILPSRYIFTEYKDLLHFYFFLGIIPLSILVFLVNVFIGPATLTEIPEGYTPKEYEYEWHPITRFFAHRCFWNNQECYERNLHYLVEEDTETKMRLMSWKVQRLMRERGDYPIFFNTPLLAGKWARSWIEEGNEHRHYYSGNTGE